MTLVLQVREDLAAAPVTTIPLRQVLEAAGWGFGKLPDPVLAEVLRLWDTGRNTTEIAAAVGTSPSAVAEYVRTHRERGPPRRPAHYGHAREVLEEHGAELRAAYEGGESYAILAESVGIAPAVLRAYLVAEGVAIRNQGTRPRRANA
ncbi:MAG TPA: hypothetical protein HA263_00040 [Methanoregulaceae archaeon]|nr:hypothetical protein [Methanoregulaceae archaeon]